MRLNRRTKKIKKILKSIFTIKINQLLRQTSQFIKSRMKCFNFFRMVQDKSKHTSNMVMCKKILACDTGYGYLS